MEKQPKKSIFKENRTFWRNPVTVALCALLLFFSAQLFGFFFSAPLLEFIPSQNIRLVVLISANTFALFGLVSVAKNLLGFKWRALGLTLPSAKNLAIVVPALAVYFLISISLTALAMRFIPGFDAEQAQEIGFSKTKAPIDLIAAFLSLVVLTPLFEEVIFRGVLFKGLRRRLPFFYSALFTSIVFALAHGQWNVAVDTFALSMILCFLVEKSGSIVPAIALHALKNSLAFVLLFVVGV